MYPSEKREELLENLIKQFKMNPAMASEFKNFMLLRFSDEFDEGYITEWAERFSAKKPHLYMDSESLNVYVKVLGHNELYRRMGRG